MRSSPLPMTPRRLLYLEARLPPLAAAICSCGLSVYGSSLKDVFDILQLRIMGKETSGRTIMWLYLGSLHVLSIRTWIRSETGNVSARFVAL